VAGFVLMEDLGRRHFVDAYLEGASLPALTRAVDMLQVLQRIPPSSFPPYTADRLQDELAIFTTWLVEGVLDSSPPPEWPVFATRLVRTIASQPVAAVHRDYHCKNLLLRPDGTLGIVDFQDALAGPALYDLASLLRDCYWRFDEATIRTQLDRYLAASPLRFEDPWTLFNLTALQRQLKAIGIFARLRIRDDKRSHLCHIGPVLEHATFLARMWPEGRPIAAWLHALKPGVQARVDKLAHTSP